MVKGKTYSKVQPSSLKKIGRRSAKSVAFQVLVKSHVLNILGQQVRREMKVLCGVLKSSVLRSSSPKAVESLMGNADRRVEANSI